MSVYPRAQRAQTVAVAPTETTLQTFDVDRTSVLALHLYNADATQTFQGSLRLQARPDESTAVLPFAQSEWLGLRDVVPLTARCVDVPVGGLATLAVVGTMSGAGGNVVLSARDLPAT